MVQLIWRFNEFMERKFSTLSMGLTPSGHLHVGFLTTLACALLYLKEHPGTKLIITNIENSLSSRLEKYNNVPLRFQYIKDGDLMLPEDYRSLRKRDRVTWRIHMELSDLIWKLIQAMDQRTSAERKAIDSSAIPPEHKRILDGRENRILRFMDSPILVFSFSEVLRKDGRFSSRLKRWLTDYEFSEVVAPMLGIKPRLGYFGSKIAMGEKLHRPRQFTVPIRLYCPACNHLTGSWASVVTGHPSFGKPTLVAKCKSFGCKNSEQYVTENLDGPMELAEFHFLLDPMRDFLPPFQAEAHIFGGDYFQLEYSRSGMKAIDKVASMFAYMERKTGQEKVLFGGPLITIGGKKMSKTQQAFNIKDVPDITKAFLEIVDYLEDIRHKDMPRGFQIEYDQLVRKRKR